MLIFGIPKSQREPACHFWPKPLPINCRYQPSADHWLSTWSSGIHQGVCTTALLSVVTMGRPSWAEAIDEVLRDATWPHSWFLGVWEGYNQKLTSLDMFSVSGIRWIYCISTRNESFGKGSWGVSHQGMVWGVVAQVGNTPQFYPSRSPSCTSN